MAWIGAVITAAAALTAGIVQNSRNKKAATRQYKRGQRDRAWTATYDQALWQQQNNKNQDLWNQQNKYNESRVAKENAYSRETWELENKYNSPQQQMARYGEAGLNPHLIYGQGTPGNAGDLASGTMRADQADSNGLSSPDAKGYTREQVETLNLGQNVFRDQLEFKNLQAQTDNVEAQEDNQRQDTINKSLAGEKLASELPYTGDKAFQSLEAARLNTEQQRQLLRTHTSNAHLAEGTADNKIQLIATQVKEAGEKLHGAKLDNAMKSYLEELKKIGLNEHSSTLFRVIYQYLNRYGSPVKKMDGSKYTY